MKTYLMTSPSFEGEVEFVYNDMDLLERFDASRALLGEKQQIWLLKNFPRELLEAEKLLENNPHIKFYELKMDITFELFWNRYGEKIRSSKKKAQAKWSRLTKLEQIKSYQFIPIYEKSIQNGISKKYAETYLQAELWNN